MTMMKTDHDMHQPTDHSNIYTHYIHITIIIITLINYNDNIDNNNNNNHNTEYICKRSPGRIARYQAINKLIARALTSAVILVTEEPSELARADG